MLAAHETPDQTHKNHGAHNISGPDMLGQEVIFREVGDKKCQDQGPVPDADYGVPYLYRIFSGYHVSSPVEWKGCTLVDEPCWYNPAHDLTPDL
jgi:hypothetical protein